MSGGIKWLALESNPDMLNKYIGAIGVPDKYQFVDVYGTDPDLLQMVPQPVFAVLLLFAINGKTETSDKMEEERITKEGQTVSKKAWFMKQTIGNACGTVAVLHSLANNEQSLKVKPKSPLASFLEKTKTLGPAEKGKFLETCHDLAAAHESSAKTGQTKTPDLNSDVDNHFIAFVFQENSIYELDGRKTWAVNHGYTSPDTFLQDVVTIIDQKFIARDRESNNFSMIALSQVL